MPTATDLYYRGANPFGLTCSGHTVTFESTYMHCYLSKYINGTYYPGSAVLNCYKVFNFSSYNRLIAEIKYVMGQNPENFKFNIYGVTQGGTSNHYSSPVYSVTPGVTFTTVIDLADKTVYTINTISFEILNGCGGQSYADVYRIRFE